jgi:hypothetical protein
MASLSPRKGAAPCLQWFKSEMQRPFDEPEGPKATYLKRFFVCVSVFEWPALRGHDALCFLPRRTCVRSRRNASQLAREFRVSTCTLSLPAADFAQAHDVFRLCRLDPGAANSVPCAGTLHIVNSCSFRLSKMSTGRFLPWPDLEDFTGMNKGDASKKFPLRRSQEKKKPTHYHEHGTTGLI